MAQAAPWACVESLCRVDDGGERGHMWRPLERFRRRCPIIRPWLAALQPLLATSVYCERLFILCAANRQPQQRHGCRDRVLVPRARRQLSQQTLACGTISPTPNRRSRCCNPPGDCVAARNPYAGHCRLRRTLRADWVWCGAGGCRVPSGFKCIRCFAELGGHGRKCICGCVHIFRVHEPLAPVQSFLSYLLCLGRSFLQNFNPHFSHSFLLQLSIHLECLPAA
jgi:hypothetical protein